MLHILCEEQMMLELQVQADQKQESELSEPIVMICQGIMRGCDFEWNCILRCHMAVW